MINKSFWQREFFFAPLRLCGNLFVNADDSDLKESHAKPQSRMELFVRRAPPFIAFVKSIFNSLACDDIGQETIARVQVQSEVFGNCLPDVGQ